MQRHRPVVADRAHDAREARVQCGLRAPRVRGDERCLGGQARENRCEQLRGLLIGGIVAQLAEALGIHRLPDELVEERIFLAPARAHRVQLVLSRNDARAVALGEAQKIEPVGLFAHRGSRGGDRHGDAVVAKTHADVAHKQSVLPQIRRHVRAGDEILRAEIFGDDRCVLHRHAVLHPAVVAVLAHEARLLFDSLFIVLFPDLVSKNHPCPIHFSCLLLTNADRYDSLTIS